MLLAVPNLSEGRDRQLVDEIARVHGLLDVHTDADHNRAVLTIAGDVAALVDACLVVAARAVERLDLRRHRGVHPRFGVLDVLPFVAYGGEPVDAETAALAAARRIGEELDVPVHLYGGASPEGRTLPTMRRELAAGDPPPPAFGPRHPHPTAGVVCVGVRGPLLAFNVNLRGPVEAARQIAAAVREGLPFVRALAFALPSRGLVQVSMNLVEPLRTGPRDAFERVRDEAHQRGLEVAGAEVVGLAQEAVMDELASLPLIAPARSVESLTQQK